MKENLFTATFAILVVLLLAGCSHNFGVCVIGKGVIVGEAGFQFFNGFALLDTSRENSSWSIELTDEDAPASAGSNFKGVRKITRTLGRQASGYLVDLAKEDPKAVEDWLGGEHEDAQAPSCARKKHGDAQAPSCAEKEKEALK